MKDGQTCCDAHGAFNQLNVTPPHCKKKKKWSHVPGSVTCYILIDAVSSQEVKICSCPNCRVLCGAKEPQRWKGDPMRPTLPSPAKMWALDIPLCAVFIQYSSTKYCFWCIYCNKSLLNLLVLLCCSCLFVYYQYKAVLWLLPSFFMHSLITSRLIALWKSLFH